MTLKIDSHCIGRNSYGVQHGRRLGWPDVYDKRVAVYRLRDPILKAVALRVKTSSKDRKDADPSERIV
jgi:hypothetical protein